MKTNLWKYFDIIKKDIWNMDLCPQILTVCQKLYFCLELFIDNLVHNYNLWTNICIWGANFIWHMIKKLESIDLSIDFTTLMFLGLHILISLECNYPEDTIFCLFFCIKWLNIRGAWVVRSVKLLTLGFTSGRDLRVVG